MKALTCEMCGSTNLIKNDGVFVCQSCGTKYSVEEAKKMMIEGTVNVAGTVKVDISDELKNLYEVARRAKDNDNCEQAAKYYDMILAKDPNSWEANFFVVYFQAMSCKIGQIAYVGDTVANAIPTVTDLVKNNVSQEEQGIVVTELYAKTISLSAMLSGAAESHYYDISVEIRDDFTQDYINNVAAAANILYTLGDCIEDIWGEEHSVYSAGLWEAAIDHHKKYLKFLADKPSNVSKMQSYGEKIKKYNPEYTLPSLDTSSGGCYIATAVYGSYDCPEVWTLRRFRDYSLAETIFGRAFIRLYYAISPTLVKWFGQSNMFKRIWRKPLDKLVIILNKKGIQNSPYNDIDW